LSDQKKHRVFVAVKAPPEWSEALLKVQENLREQFQGTKVKWVSPEQFHITLRFFGYMTSEELEPARGLLLLACGGVSSFTLRYTGLGCFPRASAPRVLWAGVEDQVGTVTRLQKKMNELTRDIGQAPEDRDFHPHLTLGRITEFPAKFREKWVHALNELQPNLRKDWVVQELLLMESQLGPSGAKHSLIAALPLQ
jgi:2'-5' RNA ligase